MNAEQIRSIPCEWCKDAACFRGVYMTHARFACHKHRDELRTAIMILSDLGDPESPPMPTEQDILSDTRTCGELSCDDCNERFAAAQRVIAELQTHEPYQRLKAAIDRGMGCAGCDRCLEDIEAEIAELRRDAERLNAITNRDIILDIHFAGTTLEYWTVHGIKHSYTTAEGDGKTVSLRDCIDRAIADAAIDAARGNGE